MVGVRVVKRRILVMMHYMQEVALEKKQLQRQKQMHQEIQMEI